MPAGGISALHPHPGLQSRCRQACRQEGVSRLRTRLRLRSSRVLSTGPLAVCLSVWARGRTGGDAVPAGSLLAPSSARQQRTRSPLAWHQGSRVSWDPVRSPHVPPPVISSHMQWLVQDCQVTTAGSVPSLAAACSPSWHSSCPLLFPTQVGDLQMS